MNIPAVSLIPQYQRQQIYENQTENLPEPLKEPPIPHSQGFSQDQRLNTLSPIKNNTQTPKGQQQGIFNFGSAKKSFSSAHELSEVKYRTQSPLNNSSISNSRSHLNNFTRDSNFIEQAQKDQYYHGIRESLGRRLNQLVINYEEQKDSQKIEDLILELHRTTQRTNGTIPQQQRAKMESLVREIEMMKIDYKTRSSLSPRLIFSNSECSHYLPLRYNQDGLNINALEIKKIVSESKSKVKDSESYRGFSSRLSQNPQQQSSDQKVKDLKIESPNISNSSYHRDYKDNIKELVKVISSINAKLLSQYFLRKQSQLQPGDYEVSYCFALIISLVDEEIPLNGEKNDLQSKSWDALQKYLANNGRVIFQLHKLKQALENPNKIMLNSLSLHSVKKRIKKFTSTISAQAQQNQLLAQFVQIIMLLLKQNQPVVSRTCCNSPTFNFQHTMEGLKLRITPSSNVTSALQTPSQAKSKTFTSSSLFSSMKEKKPLLKFSHVWKSTKNKDLSQKGSSNNLNIFSTLHEKELSRSIQIRSKELEQKVKRLQEKADEQEKGKKTSREEEKKQRQLKNEYLLYEDYNKKKTNRILNQKKYEERKELRERSLETQRMKREAQRQQAVEEYKIIQDSIKDQIKDAQWKERQKKKQKENQKQEVQERKQMYEDHRKQKIQSEQKWSGKNSDQKFEKKMDKVNVRFKQLEEQEQYIRKQMEEIANDSNVLQSSNLHTSQIDESYPSQFNSLFTNNTTESQKLNTIDIDYPSQRNLKNDPMKSLKSALRPRSNDKVSSIMPPNGSTGGSSSYIPQAIIKRPVLRLNTNLINQPSSIMTPQSSQNNHSNRMVNYLASPSQPLNQSETLSKQAVNQLIHSNTNSTGPSSSQQRSRQQTSQLVPKKVPSLNQDLQSFLPSTGEQSNNTVKVGNSVPKTATSQNNLKNFSNLKQFNQIFNQGKQVQSPSNNRQKQEELNYSSQSSNANDKAFKQMFLQNHSRHIQQQQQNKMQFHKSKGSQDLTGLTQTIKDGEKTITYAFPSQRVNPKNLQINIPSPREQDLPQSQDSSTDESSKGRIIASGPHSTTNANAGSIKLNKFSCHSTRNDSQKTNIFSAKQQSNQIEQGSQRQDQQDQPMQLQPAHKIIIPNHENTKHSLKRNGVVRAYAANTNQGLVRDYNEDRVSIILNILQPANRQSEHWPRCSFFGIYDGHGGSACADFLRDNLHQFVIKEASFPSNPKEAIRQGFANAERKFIELCLSETNIIDKSGSCAIVALIVEDQCYVANVGDSRALLSAEQGGKIYALSRDHKPNDEMERKRIIEGGGQIYHRTTAQNVDSNNPSKKEIIVGPLRVLPGRLSVSRTFGDAEAKLSKFGGNPKVVIAEPEIKSFKITKDHDFIVLGCDGIFDKLSNQDTIACAWNSVRDNKQLGLASNVHKQSGMAVEYILKNSLLRRTLDNVTVVLIAFSSFKRSAFGSASSPLTAREQNKRDVSNQNSTLEGTSVNGKGNSESRVKENIPPADRKPKNSEKVLPTNKSKGSLQINTSQLSTKEGPKSQTNAQIQENLKLRKMSQQQENVNLLGIGSSTCTNSSTLKSKHFDFSKV